MICENREDFQISQIFIDKSLIYDSEGNIIFIINDYTSLDQFACDISLNSAEIENNTDIIEPEEEETDEPAESNKKINLPFRKGSSGLSKGGLAGIIISIISVITILVFVIVLKKKGNVFAQKKYIPENISTLDAIKLEN